MYYHIYVVTICLISILYSNFIFAGSAHSKDQYPTCSATAKYLKWACDAERRDDYFVEAANCINFNSKEKRSECRSELKEVRKEAFSECKQVYQARLNLCNRIGQAPYDPEFGEDHANQFVDPLEIGKSITPNLYFPLISGQIRKYESKFTDEDGEDVTETIVITITDRTKVIQGITCLVLNDRVEENGVVVEDTDDWYTQDIYGNVWYCGEIAQNYELFDGDTPEIPELVDIEGSWKAGRDGSKAGILIPAVPEIGEVIRQEVSWGNAEDVIEILSTTGSESSPAASCAGNCLVTRDFTPLESAANENKYYAPGIGPIVEINLNTGERLELIEFFTP